MKLLWVSNSPMSPTGFGQQVRLTSEELSKLGYEIEILCRPHAIQGDRPFVEHHLTDYTADHIDQRISDIQPDAVICFDGHQLLMNLMQMRITPANCPVYFWWPFEGIVRPDYTKDQLNGVPQASMIHLSQFAVDLWQHGDRHIGHAVDPAFRPLPKDDQTKLRKKWAKKLKLPLFHDSFLLFNINRNFLHKGWDRLIYLVKLLKDEHGMDVQLLCHTDATRDENVGGKDLPQVARLMGVGDEVMFTKDKVTPEELNELYNMADCRVDMSGSEGFGLTVLEAYQAGCPQIVNNHTTMPEVLDGEEQCLFEPASWSFHMGTIWADPDVAAMARTLAQEGPPEYNSTPSVTPEDIAHQWDAVLRNKKYDPWTKCRFGMHHQFRNTARTQSVARLCKSMNWQAFEVGVHDGSFLEWCRIFNVRAFGLDTEENICTIPQGTKDLVRVGQYTDPWPEDADVLVLTDMQDLLFDAEAGIVDELLQRIQRFDHVVVSLNPCFKWGQRRFNPDQFRTYLESGGLSRNNDAEVILRKKLPNFSHEVWSVSPITLPKDLK